MPSNNLTIYTDGGARGNPGPAASAYLVIDSSGHTLMAQGFFLGTATNNVAEYHGLISALTWLVDYLKNHPIQDMEFKLDSLLVVNQLKGLYKVKEPTLRSLHLQANSLIAKLNVPYRFIHIPRSQNIQADYLVNQTLDIH